MRTRRARGQSIVELAVIAPLLLIILLGVVDLALAFNTQLAIRQAVAEGAYFAAQNPRDDDGVRARIISELSWLSPALTNGDITINRAACGANNPETQIIVSYDYTPMFAAIGVADQMQLSADSTVPQFGNC